MMVQPHEVTREEGDGSRSANGDRMVDERWEHKDQRANTETTFWPQDISKLNVSEARKRELRRVLRRNEGENQGEPYQDGRNMRRDANRYEWKRRLTSVHCSQFGLTPHQKERTQHLVQDVIDFSSFASYSKEQAILGVINVVVREDGRWIEDEERFLDVAANEGLTRTDLRHLRRMVKRSL